MPTDKRSSERSRTSRHSEDRPTPHAADDTNRGDTYERSGSGRRHRDRPRGAESSSRHPATGKVNGSGHGDASKSSDSKGRYPDREAPRVLATPIKTRKCVDKRETAISKAALSGDDRRASREDTATRLGSSSRRRAQSTGAADGDGRTRSRSRADPAPIPGRSVRFGSSVQKLSRVWSPHGSSPGGRDGRASTHRPSRNRSTADSSSSRAHSTCCSSHARPAGGNKGRSATGGSRVPKLSRKSTRIQRPIRCEGADMRKCGKKWVTFGTIEPSPEEKLSVHVERSDRGVSENWRGWKVWKRLGIVKEKPGRGAKYLMRRGKRLAVVE